MSVTDELSPKCSSISWKCQIQHCYMICTLCLAFYECRLVAFLGFRQKTSCHLKKFKHCQSPTQTHTHLSLLNTQGLEFEWVSVVSVCIILLIHCWYYVLLKKRTPKHSGFDEKALLKSYWLIFDPSRFSSKAITMRIRVMASNVFILLEQIILSNCYFLFRLHV